MMVAPDVCLYCDHLLVRDDDGTRHRTDTPCRAATPCQERERELRWQEWLTSPPMARTPGRGGAAHVIRYGSTQIALCGKATGAASSRRITWPACRACLNAWSHIDYAWRYEKFWRKPYGGSGINDLAKTLGLRPDYEEPDHA